MTSLFRGAALTLAALAAAAVVTAPAQAVPTQAGQTQAGQGGRPPVTCVFTPTPENPAAKPIRVPKAKAKSHGTARAMVITNYGAVTLKLDRANAPCGVHNFVHLIRGDFYNNTQCFRLTNSERLGVLQCGDIYRAEEGGPGYKFADEVTGAETYPRGTIAMGNQGPGTNGSEFFIVHSVAKIRPVYTVLGSVTDGMNTLDRIVAAGISPDGAVDGAPRYPVRILWAGVIG